jgi:ankyrin repeat protein
MSLSSKHIRSEIFNYIHEFDSNDDQTSHLLHPISGKSLGVRSDTEFIGETHAENLTILPRINGLRTMRVCLHERQDLQRVAETLWRNRFTLKSIDLDMDKLTKRVSTGDAMGGIGQCVNLLSDYLNSNGADEDDLPESDEDEDSSEQQGQSASSSSKQTQDSLPSLVLLCQMMIDAGFNPSKGTCSKAQALRLRRTGILPASQLRMFLQFFPEMLDLSLDCVISQAGVDSIPKLCPKIVNLATDLVDGARVEPLEQAKFLKKLTLGGIGSLLMTAATIPAALDGATGDGSESSFPLSMMRKIAVCGPQQLGYNVGIRLSFDEEESVRTVLQVVISASDLRTLEWMLRAGADPNNELYLEQSQRSALFHAFQLYSRTSSGTFLRLVHKLLDYGANIFAPCQPGSVSFIHHLVNRGELELIRNCLFEKRKIFVKKPGSVFRPKDQVAGQSFPKDNMLGFVSALLNVVAGAATMAREGTAVQEDELCEFDEVWMTPYEYSKSLYVSDEELLRHALPKDGLSLVHAAASWLPEAPSHEINDTVVANKLILLSWLVNDHVDHFGSVPPSHLFLPEFIGNVHSISSKMRTPMHSCAHPAIVDFLVSRGAAVRGDPNLSALLPLHAAAYYGKLSTMKSFMAHSGSEDTHSALQWAIRGGRPDAVLFLFGLGASLPQGNLIELHDSIKSYSSCVFLASLVSSSTRLVGADEETIRKAFTLIWQLPSCSEEEKVAFLSESFGSTAEYGSIFAEPLNSVIVSLLQMAGPIIVTKANERSKTMCGLTLLMSATGAKSLSRVRALLDLVPDLVNEVDKEGQSALHYAAAPPTLLHDFEAFISNTHDIAIALVDAGINVLAKSATGMTALDVATDAPGEIQQIFAAIHKKARKAKAKPRAKKGADQKNTESSDRKVLPGRKAKSKKRDRDGDDADDSKGGTESSKPDPTPKNSDANTNQDDGPQLRRSKRRKLE